MQKGPVQSEAIKVCVRIRPLASFEDGDEIAATPSSESTVEVSFRISNQKY